MVSKKIVIDKPGGIQTRYKLKEVLMVISITLLTLMVILTYKLIMNLISPNVSVLYNETNKFIYSFLAINIVTCLIVYKYQLVINKFKNGDEMKKVELKGVTYKVPMVGTELVRNEDDLMELYEWLLMRTKEQESNGYENKARVYREYAETVSQNISLNCA